MRNMDQPELFMLHDGNDALDQRLAARGYRIVDPVLIFCAPAATLARINPAPLDAIPCEEPLRLAEEFWEQGGINAQRVDVMRRTRGPKTYLLSRYKDMPAGAAFVAIDGDIAMLHALEVSPDLRRFGIGRKVLGRAALWAIENGAEFLSVVTTGENLPAQGLFTSLGMQVVGKYHYRMK
jgi:ribosomal protein S18 acetylase RimI-like enzyme